MCICWTSSDAGCSERLQHIRCSLFVDSGKAAFKRARTASALDVPLAEHSIHCVLAVTCSLLVAPATLWFNALAYDEGSTFLFGRVACIVLRWEGNLTLQLWHSFGTEHALLLVGC
jgi:hypothetical protein